MPIIFLYYFPFCLFQSYFADRLEYQCPSLEEPPLLTNCSSSMSLNVTSPSQVEVGCCYPPETTNKTVPQCAASSHECSTKESWYYKKIEINESNSNIAEALLTKPTKTDNVTVFREWKPRYSHYRGGSSYRGGGYRSG